MAIACGPAGAAGAADPPAVGALELSALTGPKGADRYIDAPAGALNGLSADPPSRYSIGGLPATATFNLALSNATGNGENSHAGTVTTDLS